MNKKKIHSLAMFIAIPFILTGGVILYFLFFEDQEDWFKYLFPVVIILATLYTLHPKIDFWWHKKHPPELDQKLKKLISTASPFFLTLSEEGKRKFLDRLSIFIHHKAFYIMRQEKEEMPIDMKVVVALNGITLTFNEDNYFYDKFDYFIVYQHPFPTPARQALHSVEVNYVDGVMLFNSDQLFRSSILKTVGFNVGLYAFAEVYLNNFPMSDIAQMDEPDLLVIDQFEVISLKRIYQEIGYKEVYAKAIIISLYFSYPEELNKYYPDYFETCTNAFAPV